MSRGVFFWGCFWVALAVVGLLTWAPLAVIAVIGGRSWWYLCRKEQFRRTGFDPKYPPVRW